MCFFLRECQINKSSGSQIKCFKCDPSCAVYRCVCSSCRIIQFFPFFLLLLVFLFLFLRLISFKAANPETVQKGAQNQWYTGTVGIMGYYGNLNYVVMWD